MEIEFWKAKYHFGKQIPKFNIAFCNSFFESNFCISEFIFLDVILEFRNLVSEIAYLYSKFSFLKYIYCLIFVRSVIYLY